MGRGERSGLGALFFGSIWLWQRAFGWHGWETFYAIGLSMVTTLVLGGAGEAVKDTWPRGVPYEMKATVAEYEAEGWRLTRIHPWWQCHGRTVASVPHVHLMRDRQLLMVASHDLAAQLPRHEDSIIKNRRQRASAADDHPHPD
jgi:hypothetical protein